MDAIEPEILARAEMVVKQQPEVKELERLRMRWLGHHLHAEVYIAVDPNLSTTQSHEIAELLRHALFHEIANLAEVTVHVDPWSPETDIFHQNTTHHEPTPRPLSS
jgi:divalent metal cation (Fe/Co/Zn/Cd) transporter